MNHAWMSDGIKEGMEMPRVKRLANRFGKPS
jgi:hypothetical protein